MKNDPSGSVLEHSLPWPEAAPKASTHTAATPPKPLLIQPLGALPPSHQSASAEMQPQPPSGASYAVYLHPSQAVTAYSPSFMLQPLPRANVKGIKSINPKALSEMTSKEGDNCTAAADPGKAIAAKERPVMESESSSKSCLKRSQALQESNLIKKCRIWKALIMLWENPLNTKDHPPLAHKPITKRTTSRNKNRTDLKHLIRAGQVVLSSAKENALQKMRTEPKLNKMYLWHLPVLLMRPFFHLATSFLLLSALTIAIMQVFLIERMLGYVHCSTLLPKVYPLQVPFQ